MTQLGAFGALFLGLTLSACAPNEVTTTDPGGASGAALSDGTNADPRAVHTNRIRFATAADFGGACQDATWTPTAGLEVVVGEYDGGGEPTDAVHLVTDSHGIITLQANREQVYELYVPSADEVFQRDDPASAPRFDRQPISLPGASSIALDLVVVSGTCP